MVKQVKISSFTEVKNIMNAASGCCDDIGVHDAKGSIADAKSILGLMSLDYTKPVMLVSENERELEHVFNAKGARGREKQEKRYAGKGRGRGNSLPRPFLYKQLTVFG